MKYAELVSKLSELGYEYRRPAKGGHEIWWHPKRKVYTTIPHHASKDIHKGTLSAILGDLGLTREDLNKT